MKCKTCGHSTRTLQAMLKHYKDKHPAKLKRKPKTVTKRRKTLDPDPHEYCPRCGKPL